MGIFHLTEYNHSTAFTKKMPDSASHNSERLTFRHHLPVRVLESFQQL